jgi:hypothetical protein
MLFVLLVGMPLGQPIVASVSAGILHCEEHFGCRMTGAALRQPCANRLYSCGSGEPYQLKTMRLRGSLSQGEKADFHRFSQVFVGKEPKKHRFGLNFGC